MTSRPTSLGRSPFRVVDRLLFPLLSAALLLTVADLLSAWFTKGTGLGASIAFWVATALLLRKLTHFLARWSLLPLMRRPETPEPQAGLRVAAITTFVPHAESIEMLELTVSALVAMHYRHDTWVLDEGDDPRVIVLCERLGARHFSRKGRPEFQQDGGPFQARTKHGNYNAFFAERGYADYDVVVAFDTDHVPAPHYLLRVLGHFRDPAVGYVQAAPAYYNQAASFIARGAAEETYAYVSSTQMVNHTLGHPVVVGSHNAHRVTALEAVGGFAPHDADDLLITLRYRASAWRGVYVPELLAWGITPVNWPDYLAQQLRWARSTLDVKFWVYPRLAGRMSLRDRVIAFGHGLYYLRGVTAFFALLCLGWVLATGRIPEFLSVETTHAAGSTLLVLQATQLFRQRFYLHPSSEVGLHWRTMLLEAAKWPVFLLAFVQAIRRTRQPYSITPKQGRRAGGHVLWRAHLPIVLFVTSTWATGMLGRREQHPVLTLWAGIVVALSLALMATEWLSYPPAFDGRLWPGRSYPRAQAEPLPEPAPGAARHVG